MKKALVLLHGFGEDASIWEEFKNDLSSDLIVLTPDFSRHSHLHSMEEYADFLINEINAEGIEKFHLIGHSMGGYISLAMAEKYPEQIISLGLFHSTAYDDSEETKENRVKRAEFILKNGTEAFMNVFVPNLFAEEFVAKNPDIIQIQIAKGKKIPKEALASAMLSMKNRPDRTPILKKANYRILFIIGEKDKAINPADARAQMMTPKFFSISILDEVGHMGMLEDKEETLKVVRRFLLG